jgi:hypothetical protein
VGALPFGLCLVAHLVQNSDVRNWSGSTLAERLDHLRETRQVPRPGKSASQNEFAAQLDIEGGTYSRLRERGVGVPYAGEVKTLYKIATALRVSFSWLAIGQGQPDDVAGVSDRTATYGTDDAWPNRTAAIKIVLAGGMDPTAVAWLLSEAVAATTDQPVLWWIERLQAKAAMLQLAADAGRSDVARFDTGDRAPPASASTLRRALRK